MKRFSIVISGSVAQKAHQRGSMLSRSRMILPVVVFVLLLGQVSLAATFYVATTGSDSNPGTELQPFRTIKKGVSVLSAGSTLYVKSGTYPEGILSSQIPTIAGTSWTNPITIAAYPGHEVIMKPPSGSAAFWFNNPSMKYLIINGFIIDGQRIAWHGVKLHAGTNHIRIINCEIKNALYSGILIGGESASDYHEFIDLKVHHNGTDNHDHGIYVETSNNLVEGCEFHSNSGWGIHVYNARSSVRANYNIVRSNFVHDNGTAASYAFGIILSSGTGNTAYNNIVVRNGGGIQVEYFSPLDTKVYNNTIWSNRGEGIRIGSGSSTTLVKNNIVYQNPVAIANTGSGTVQSNNSTSDPGFVNAAGGDFQLQLGSGAIDAGVTLSEVTLDYDKKPRPQGASHDIGAFESGQTQQSSAPGNLRIVSP